MTLESDKIRIPRPVSHNLLHGTRLQDLARAIGHGIEPRFCRARNVSINNELLPRTLPCPADARQTPRRNELFYNAITTKVQRFKFNQSPRPPVRVPKR